MIIDTYVEEICTLHGEENTSGSLLVLRLEMYTFTCVVELLQDKSIIKKFVHLHGHAFHAGQAYRCSYTYIDFTML